ncbi:helix-hairpin-helix domain-containing protein [Streptomyces sp. NPDC013455]|uniref:helix-hairpin-helix domain-containing protein n=1 Tax=Streptomyces sp. NPDC013455 TaxID=3155605 RepID=UPI0033EBBB40
MLWGEERVELGPALRKRLARAGVPGIDALLGLNERELGALGGIGPTTVREILDRLAGAGLSLAPDPYAAYECARHSEPARDAELRSYFLCGECREAYSSRAFDGRPPAWVSGERVEGYCGHCNALTEVRLTQWFLCGTCDRVMRSVGRSLASARFVAESWAAAFGEEPALTLTETDPVELRPRAKRSDAGRVASADFVASRPTGEPVLGLELKSGRSALPHGGIGAPMGMFQLDTTDCDDIAASAASLDAPVLLVHAQVIGRAHAPTERYEAVGLWFARPWDLAEHLSAIRQRPRETRPAAYFRPLAFRPFREFPEYVRTRLDGDLERMRGTGFPPLYSS